MKLNNLSRRLAAWLTAAAMGLSLLGSLPVRALAADAAPDAAATAETAGASGDTAGDTADASTGTAGASAETAAMDAALAAGLPVGGLLPLQAETLPAPADETLPAADDSPAGLLAQFWQASSAAGYLYNGLSDAEKAAYLACDTAFANVVDLPQAAIDASLGLTSAQLGVAVTAYLNDHPEVFWVGGGYTKYGANVVTSVGLSGNWVLTRSAAELAAMQKAYDAAADALLAGVDTAGTPAVVALRVHDALAAHVTYDTTAASTGAYLPHTAYGALVDGRAVCDGYAKAYEYLLNRCGITASVVTSTALLHAWSIVSLGADWYETDVTWDDDGDAGSHSYYDLTTAQMTAAHKNTGRTMAGTNLLLPTATGTLYTYAWLLANGGAAPTAAPTATPTPTPTAAPTATPAPTPTPTPDPGTGVAGFVTRLYQVCLDRQPEAAGKADWISRLQDGKSTGAQAAYGFVFSQEFKAKNYCNEDFVKRLYLAMMGRQPDAAGLADWVSRLETGAKREEVFNGFALSSEFTALCAGYGIARGGGIAVPAYGTVPTGPCSADGKTDGVTAFVTRLYTVCLGRAPDAAGLADWTNRLWAHTASGSQTAYGFIFSSEFRGKNYSDTAYVQQLYRAFMGREYDAPGLAYWVDRLKNGAGREDVFNGFAGSREFTSICQSYGITRD